VSIHPGAYPTDGAPPPPDSPLRCGTCRTDRHLRISSIEELSPPSNAMVQVSYACNACGLFSTHPADVAQVALALSRAGGASEVVIFRGQYIHCGPVMERIGSALRRLQAPSPADRPADKDVDVYVPTRVLRCVWCGFRIELPD
jgi:DNA-directed RNA polymerase subunit RPC12/RpoP